MVCIEEQADKWWFAEGKFIDPDTSDVPWYDKRGELAKIAYIAGFKAAKAEAAQPASLSDEEIAERKFPRDDDGVAYHNNRRARMHCVAAIRENNVSRDAKSTPEMHLGTCSHWNGGKCDCGNKWKAVAHPAAIEALREFVKLREAVADAEEESDAGCSCDVNEFHTCQACTKLKEVSAPYRQMLDRWADTWAMMLYRTFPETGNGSTPDQKERENQCKK